MTWRDADEALEVVGELALVVATGPRCKLRQGQVGSRTQEDLGPLDAARDHILVGWQPRARLKLPGEVVGVEACHGRDLGQGRGGVKVFLAYIRGPEGIIVAVAEQLG